MIQRLATGALFVLLAVVGAAGWWLQLRGNPEVDPSPLAALPATLGAWHSTELPMEPSVADVLDADYNLQREYRDPDGARVWLYVGYYGTGRGGRPQHTPAGCYTGAGWEVADTRRLDVDGEAGLRVNELRVQRGGQERLVHYWYRSHRRTGMLGGLDQNLDRLVGRLFHGRADGALVRLSTPFSPGDEAQARERLSSLAAAVDPLIARHWPSERAGGDAG